MSYNFLVVDDTNFMRKMAADCLKQYGHVVVGEATNGREAIKLYEELQPDIVMMDLTMPEMNGLDAITEILKIDPAAVILICSASNQQEMIVEALETGAKGYLMKPFKPDRLNEIIRKYAEPHILSKKQKEIKRVSEPSWEQSISKEADEIIAKYDDDTTSIYGSDEIDEEITLTDEQTYSEDKILDIEVKGQVENLEVEPTFTSLIDQETEDEVQNEETEVNSQIEEEQAVSYAEEMLVEFSSVKEEESEQEQEVFLELEQEADSEIEHEEGHDPVVEFASKPVNQKTYKFPVTPNHINFVTSYMCNWQDEVSEKQNQYTFVCSEEANKVSIEMTNDNEKQKVELSLDGFRQLFNWMEGKFEENRKEKAVVSE